MLDTSLLVDLPVDHSVDDKAVRPLSLYGRRAKRWIDVGGVILILPVVAPVLLIACFLTCLQGGPVFFGHVRIGRGGRAFRCWKIRTMIPDAPEQLERLLATDAGARAEWMRCRKLRHDPRVTRLGRLLRRTSLDELPQLWNVLKGEMSLVGPRPVTLAELPGYGLAMPRYLALRPGVTGLWQVSGRTALRFDARADIDARYHDTLSFAGDLRILCRTAGEVLRRSGV